MSVLLIIIILVIFSVAVWALITYVPLPPVLRKIIIAVAVIGAIVWLLQISGAWHYLFAVKV